MHDSPLVMLGRLKWACRITSLPPGNCFIDQTTADFSGRYLTLPADALNSGESASAGTGIRISTLFAVERCLNWLFA